MTRARKNLRISRPLLVSLFFSFTLVIGAPLHIYLTNRLEFAFSTRELVVSLSPVFLVLFLALACFLALLRGPMRSIAIATVFVLSILLWVQGNLLVWDYGLFDGRDIDWKALWLFGVIDGSIWVVGLGLAVRRAEWLTKTIVSSLSVLFVLMQCLSLGVLLARTPPRATYRLDWSKGKFTFSSGQNVLVLILDSFQADLFQELIDDDPSIASFFDGFVYFRNAVSGYRQSHPSIANILTATFYDNSVPMWDYTREAYLSDSSLPKFLLENGYRVDVYEQEVGLFRDPRVVSNVKLDEDSPQPSSEIWYTADVALFRYLPHFLKSSIYNDQFWLLSRWVRERRDASEDESPDAGQSTRLGQDASDRRQQRIQLFTTDARSKLQNVRFAHQFVKYAKVGYRQNTFKFYHVMGTHLPLRMTRQFEYRELERSRDSMKEVATGVVGLVKIMFDQLKDLGVFQESLIVVAADHGMWTSISKVRIPDDLALNDENSVPTSRSQLPERKGTVLPLVLVKRPGSSGPLLANDAPVALADIPRTIVSELGYAGEAFPGQSVFEVAVDSPRERKVFFSTFRQNPAYSEPYRSTMTEFLVSGFSWLDSSWKKTGKLYPPPDASSGTTTSGQD